ncbi:DUF2243 domain-containing protein [Bacillus sp. DJP31]|uniref:DUF2243 domain-containing protein n=1 Tax=Bacillus sp. DJP31 TaxID=3409789 RepID=UPI003BB631E4
MNFFALFVLLFEQALIGSFILGFGFLGALDGIIFHQILQWHSVIMNTDRAGQIVSDGIFHLAVSIALVVGGILLWLAGKPTDLSSGVRKVLGWFLIGGGTFNLVEGIINHHILQIHRVKPDDPNVLVYDLAFLASGVLLLVIGFLLKQHNHKKRENSVHV